MTAGPGLREEQSPLRDATSRDAAYDPARDEMVDSLNLSQKRTGVDGTIFISTRMAAHDPRIKWWPGRPDRVGPCLVVTLEDTPRALNLGLTPRDARTGEATASAWAALNRETLLCYWQDGVLWMEEDVAAFLDGLKKLP
jgi:hypothetical protein